MKRKLCLIATMLLLMSAFVTPVYAISETCVHGNQTFNDKQLTGGVGQDGAFRRYYFITSSVSSDYISPISTAFSNWVNTSYPTSISIRQTTSQSDSSFDIYNNAFSGNTSGMTEHWTYSTYIEDPSSSNWGWTKIFIDCAKTSGYSSLDKAGLVGHEAGHAMGLSHQRYYSDGISIMYNYDDLRDTDKPGSIDCTNINHIYG